jgi:hypothetical protein
VALRLGQVVGVAEAKIASHVFAVPAEASNSDKSDEWERITRSQVMHLSTTEIEKLLSNLLHHAALWDGHLEKFDAVQHHIPTTVPPV